MRETVPDTRLNSQVPPTTRTAVLPTSRCTIVFRCKVGRGELGSARWPVLRGCRVGACCWCRLPMSTCRTCIASTRRVIVAEFHEAARSALGYLDTLAATGRRGSSSAGTGQEEATEGLIAVGFLHDEARPTGDCACGDMHLHEHVIVMNTAQGVDGKWSAIQHERLERNEKTAGHLLQAELRARLSDRLGIAWRPVVNGVAGVAGITDAQRRHFSKRSDDVTAEQVEAGTVGKVVDGAAGRKTRQAKREQLPIAERIAYWQTEAAAVGLTPDVVAAALDRPAPAGPATDREGGAYAAGVLERLTAQAASFHRSDLLRALADDCRQGESIATLTGRADAILSSPRVVALGEGEGGLTTRDVRRGRGGRILAYAVEQKWTTPEQLALEQALVDAAVRRAGEGCAQLDGDLVEEVIGRQPFVLSDEQAAAVRALTMSGAGVDVLHASAGTGKTSAVLGTVRQAYEAAGYRVVGAATSAKAARVLADDGGLQAATIARLLLDLDRPETGGISPRTVLVLDEASMIGTRDLAALLQHAERAQAKVLVVGDTRQLAAVDAGGGLRALQDRLGAATLTVNRRQHAEWERTALAGVAAGTPAEALRAYTAHERVTVSDTALSARAAMVTAWWGDVQEHGIDRTLMAAVRNVDRTEAQPPGPRRHARSRPARRRGADRGRSHVRGRRPGHAAAQQRGEAPRQRRHRHRGRPRRRPPGRRPRPRDDRHARAGLPCRRPRRVRLRRHRLQGAGQHCDHRACPRDRPRP